MAYISNELVNEIQKKSDIVSVISNYVTLKKTGKNYLGLCPFHPDKHDSLIVRPNSQTYKCYSCGATGNVFTFLSEHNNITFPEAVTLLGQSLGYDLKTSKIDTKKSKDYEIYDLAVKVYQNNLYSSSGQKAIEYLTNRKIDKETIKKFKIGLSLSKSMVTEFLINKNYDLDRLIALGITNEKFSDKFLNRIMFPLFDLNGNPVAFSGRIYNTTSDSKYINTTSTDIFKKSSVLYNYHNAKSNLKKSDYVIVMEGFMDVIRASTIGINTCVATMGTAFTKEHISLLKKITDNIILCFDGDTAGENATKAAITLLEEENISPRIIRLPKNLDPDEYILEYGKESFESQIENSITAIDFKLNILKKDRNLSDLVESSNYIDDAIKELVKIDDPVLVELTLKKLTTECKYNIEYNTLLNKYNNYLHLKKIVPLKEKEVVKTPRLKQHEIAEYYLIYYMLNSPEVIKKVSENVIYFKDDLIRNIYNEIESYYNKYGIITVSSFISNISNKPELLDMLNKIIVYVKKEEYTDEEINDYIMVVNRYLKKEKIKQLEQEMHSEIDPIKKAEILKKIMEVKGVKA